MPLDGDECCDVLALPGRSEADLRTTITSGIIKSPRPLGRRVVLRCGSLFTAPISIEPVPLGAVGDVIGGLPVRSYRLRIDDIDISVLDMPDATKTSQTLGYFREEIRVLPNTGKPVPPGRWAFQMRQSGVQAVVEIAGHDLLRKIRQSTRTIRALNLRSALRALSESLAASGARRELVDALNKGEDALALLPAGAPIADIRAVLMTHKAQIATDIPAIEDLAMKMCTLPVIRAKHEEAIQAAIEARIQRTKESIIASIERDTTAVRETIAKLREERQAEENLLRARREEQERQLRSTVIDELESERAKIAETRLQLERDRKAQEESLKSAERSLRELVTRYEELTPTISAAVMTTMELLGKAPVATPRGLDQAPGPSGAGSMLKSQLPTLTPVAIASNSQVSQSDFLERIHHFAALSGLAFDDAEVRAVHVAAKAGQLTILRGPPGAGKTSLVRIYANALAGSNRHTRLLEISVHPNWIDQGDFLGYVHSIDRRYVPSSSGAVPFLAAVAREHREHGQGSPMTVMLLDEINLSQPEHFLPMDAIWHPEPEQRLIRLFHQAAVREDDPLHPFASVQISPSMRMFGTMNIDDTVKPLSPRFLDRVFAIELSSRPHGPAEIETGAAPAALSAVTEVNFESWVAKTPPRFNGPTANLFQDAREHIGKSKLVSISHRSRDAIAAFVANAEGLLEDRDALDFALSSRVVSQIRGARSSIEFRNLTELQGKLEGLGLERAAAAVESIILRDSWIGDE